MIPPGVFPVPTDAEARALRRIHREHAFAWVNLAVHDVPVNVGRALERRGWANLKRERLLSEIAIFARLTEAGRYAATWALKGGR